MPLIVEVRQPPSGRRECGRRCGPAATPKCARGAVKCTKAGYRRWTISTSTPGLGWVVDAQHAIGDPGAESMFERKWRGPLGEFLYHDVKPAFVVDHHWPPVVATAAPTEFPTVRMAAGDTRQMALPTSSATNKAPDPSTA